MSIDLALSIAGIALTILFGVLGLRAFVKQRQKQRMK
jgi:hypothetical protein